MRCVPTLERGRKVMLGEELDDKGKNYVEALRINGAPIGSSIVMAAGEGLIKAHDRTRSHTDHKVLGYVTAKENGFREA